MLVSENTSQYLFGKKYRHKILFFSPPSLKSTGFVFHSSISQPVLWQLRHTQFSLGETLFYSRCISLLPMFLGIWSFNCTITIKCHFPHGGGSSEPQAGDTARRFAVTIRIPGQEEQPGLHFQPWMSLTDSGSVYLFCSKSISSRLPRFISSLLSLNHFIIPISLWCWYMNSHLLLLSCKTSALPYNENLWLFYNGLIP